MAQELVFWMLLLGMVGLIWIVTCALLTKEHSTPRRSTQAGDDRAQAVTQPAEPSQERRVAA